MFFFMNRNLIILVSLLSLKNNPEYYVWNQHWIQNYLIQGCPNTLIYIKSKSFFYLVRDFSNIFFFLKHDLKNIGKVVHVFYFTSKTATTSHWLYKALYESIAVERGVVGCDRPPTPHPPPLLPFEMCPFFKKQETKVMRNWGKLCESGGYFYVEPEERKQKNKYSWLMFLACHVRVSEWIHAP